MNIRMLVLTLISLALAPAALQAQQFSSGPERVPLIELFTSEGCSSCPPAERWMNSLERSDALWRDFVPVAFHVDYWNYLGWTDRFAKPAFSERQRNYQRQGSSRSVYTPGVFAAGEEWLGWRKRPEPAASGANGGALVTRIEGRTAAVQYAAVGSHETIVAHVALLGSALETKVKAGENRGKTLSHNFVVLALASQTMQKTEAGYRAVVDLPPSEHDANLSVAVWVSADGRQAPLQATGGHLSAALD